MTDEHLVPVPSRKRGPYAVSARLQKALMALASGEAKSQKEAASRAGMTARALSAAVKRENVRAWMQQMIAETLGLGSMRAAKRMIELVESENAMASYRASAFTLATGAGVAPSSHPGVAVNILAGQVGYAIDLRPPAESGLPIADDDRQHMTQVGGVLLGSRRGPPLIEGTATKLEK